LSWSDNSTNEKGFKIYRKAGAGVWTLLKKTGPGVKPVNDTTAENNSSKTTYQYYVMAFNDSGDSPSTNTAMIPYQPLKLKAAQGTSAGTIKLTWTDKSTNETGFEIERKSGTCASTEQWTKVATLGANKTSWTDTKRTSGADYSYRVRAYKKTGNILSAYGYSLYSNCATAEAP